MPQQNKGKKCINSCKSFLKPKSLMAVYYKVNVTRTTNYVYVIVSSLMMKLSCCATLLYRQPSMLHTGPPKGPGENEECWAHTYITDT